MDGVRTDGTWTCEIEVPESFAHEVHLDNIQIAGLFDMARRRFQAILLDGLDVPPSITSVIVRVLIDYEAELTYRDTVTIGAEIARIGGSSWTLALELHAGAQRIARCDTVNVWLTDGAPLLPPADIQARLKAHFRVRPARSVQVFT